MHMSGDNVIAYITLVLQEVTILLSRKILMSCFIFNFKKNFSENVYTLPLNPILISLLLLQRQLTLLHVSSTAKFSAMTLWEKIVKTMSSYSL